MAYFVRFELKEDLEFLQGIMHRSVESIRNGSLVKLSEKSDNIIRIYDSLVNAVPSKDLELLGADADVSKRSKRRTKEQREADGEIDPDFCKEHPKYGAQRPPRKECEDCWKQYKKFHPLEYTTARKKFEKVMAA